MNCKNQENLEMKRAAKLMDTDAIWGCNGLRAKVSTVCPTAATQKWTQMDLLQFIQELQFQPGVWCHLKSWLELFLHPECVCVDRYLGVGGHGRHQSGVETCSRSGRAVQSGGEVGANRGGLCVHKVEDCAQGGRKKQVNPSLARMQDGRRRRNSCRHICHHRAGEKSNQCNR